jgi:pseudouridine kinase
VESVSSYPLDEDERDRSYVLVIGAMAVDAKGKPYQALVPGSSTPGTVRLGTGGVGRNIAENLARLGVHTVLLSAVGNDPSGQIILESTARSGVDVRHVVTSDRHPTGVYIAILDREGTPVLEIDDMSVMETLTPALLYRKRRLFRDAKMVVMDANLLPETMNSAFKLARRYDLRVCVDPTSAILAPRVQPHLPDVYLITPNLREAEAITGLEVAKGTDVQHLAMKLAGMGVEIAIITLAERGLYYATSGENGRVTALNRDIVDLTGAGDALTAAVVFGLLNDFVVGEAVRLGISAAALTIQCQETVCPDLSLDRLYDELVV